MIKKPDLKLSQEAFEELHRRLDKVRQGTSEVKVPVAALRDLLMDHSELHALFRL
jgi:hypothetical protein